MEMDVLKYPIGLQNFPRLRKEGMLYVDKTEYIHKLVSGSSHYIFLSRPRRFGKSLTISTLEEYFRGNREFFRGLAIDSLEPRPWPRHAVLHIDFNAQLYQKEGDLESFINKKLSDWEAIYGSDERETSFTMRFLGIIERAARATGRGTVVLIDEYDKPLLDVIDKPSLLASNRDILKSFYGGMKSAQAYLRFVMLTGVGKIAQLNVFSGLNNIRDISMDIDYSGICGITEEELQGVLQPGVKILADTLGISLSEAYESLKKYYDGYHFAEDFLDIYNPFSLLSALQSRSLRSYWYATGTPTYLVKALRDNDEPIQELGECYCKPSMLFNGDVLGVNLMVILYYSGYLTLKAYDREYDEYTLGYPNEEVTTGFIGGLLPLVSHLSQAKSESMIMRMSREIRDNRIDDFLNTMKIFFASPDYQVADANEYHYQDVIYCISKLIGFDAKLEYHTSQGRIDMTLFTRTHIYIFEFKLDKSARIAMSQIDRNQYALPFEADGREIVKVAVNFSSQTRNISDWQIEKG